MISPTPETAGDATGRIAIVGMAGRFPDAATTGDLWRLLRAGREATHWFSDEELLASGVSATHLRDPRYVKAGMVLPDMEAFDADFRPEPSGGGHSRPPTPPFPRMYLGGAGGCRPLSRDVRGSHRRFRGLRHAGLFRQQPAHQCRAPRTGGALPPASYGQRQGLPRDPSLLPP